MSDQEKLEELRKQYHGKGPIKHDFTVLGGIGAKATLGFQIHDEDGNLIVDATDKGNE